MFWVLNRHDKKTFELWTVDLDHPRGFIDFEDQLFEIKKLTEYSHSSVAPDTDRPMSGRTGTNLDV